MENKDDAIPKTLFEAEIKRIREMLEIEIRHLKETMDQHDKFSEQAISKAQETLNDRLEKVNEFREQQKDIIQTFAREKETKASMEALSTRLEQGAGVLNEKINIIEKHIAEKVELVRISIEEKYQASLNQHKIQIDANAKVSNDGITLLNQWKIGIQGSIRVILAVGSFLVAIVLALMIGFLKSVL